MSPRCLSRQIAGTQTPSLCCASPAAWQRHSLQEQSSTALGPEKDPCEALASSLGKPQRDRDIVDGGWNTQNMLVYDHHTIGQKRLLKPDINTTVKAGGQTFDFLRRQLLHATDVRAALG